MRILGFDTATQATAVGLSLGEGTTCSERDDPAPGEHPGHATRLLSMAEELLARAGLRWADLDRLAVGVGPGRFTGLRVGVATARGLAQSLSLELAGVSTLRALGEGALGASEAGVLAVIDARRSEVFAAAYLGDGRGAVRELDLAGALSANELGRAVERAAGWRALEKGASAEPWLAVGDGAVRYRSALEAAGAHVPDDGSALHLVDGAVVCALGRRARAAARLEDVVPDYRRRADAERRQPAHPPAPYAAGDGART